MITLIGTGHVFNLSDAIIDIFNEISPDVICVELDKKRYNSLLIKSKDPNEYHKSRRNLPFLYKILAKFQDNMAKEYGVNAGDEMLTAIKYAENHNLPLELIDMDAQELFLKMLKKMTISEKFKLLLSGIGGLFINKERVEKELKKIENEFDDYIEKIGEKFPTIKKILIDERNNYMTKKIIRLTEEKNNIIACLGDGHIPGISKLLNQENIEFNIIRLKDLREKMMKSDISKASFSIEYNAS